MITIIIFLKRDMSVCNVKVEYIRPRYKNLKEWCEDPQNVYIGRGGIVFIDKKRYPTKDSVWANPYKINADNSREQVLELYRAHITEHLNKEASLRVQLETLRGKTLGCWCYPEPCHGDILLSLLCNETDINK
jgi:hypothetical protein